jgi:autotransporter-associated beta strand protein
LTLSGTNTYTGITTITGGLLQISADDNLGAAPGSAVANKLTLNCGTTYGLRVTGTITLSAIRGITLGASGGSIDTTSGNTATYAGVITGTGNFSSGAGYTTGYGTVQLSGANNYSGTTTIAAGTLQLAADGTLPYGTALTIAADNSAGSTLDLNGYSQTIGPLASSTGIGGTGTATPVIKLSGALTILQTGSTTFAGIIKGSGGSLTKAGSAMLTLSGTNTYSGNTTISAGTLALTGSGAINSSSQLSLAAGAAFDVSALTSPYNLSTSTTLSASGTGTTMGSTAAAIKGASSGTVSLGSQAISLTFTPTAFTGDTTHSALLISQGALTLSGNTITVNNAAATKLGAGTYRLIQVTGGTISGTPNATPTITGTGLASGTTASISASGGNVNLVVQNTTTTTLATVATPQTYGTVTFSATVSPGTAGGTVTFKDGSTTLGSGALSGGTAAFTPTASQLTVAGSPHAITAVYGGDSLDAASASSASTLNITAKALNYTGISAANKVYNATNTASLSGTAATLAQEAAGPGTDSDGKPYTGDTVSFTIGTLTGTFASPGVGNGIAVTVTGGVALGGSSAGNYSVGSPSTALTANITQKALNYTGISAANTVYSATNTASLSGTVATLTAEAPGTGSTSDGKPYTGDTVSFTTGTLTGTFASPGVGNGIAVTVTGGVALGGRSAGNYSVGSPNTALTANITPKTLMAGLTGTASKTYDGTTAATLAAGNYSLPGVVSGDTVNLNNPTSGTYNTRNVGAGKTVSVIGLAISGSSAGNYALSSTSTSAAIGTINRTNLTVTATANTKTYDGTTSAAATPALTSGSIQNGDAGHFTETYDTQNAGTGKTLTPAGTVTDGNSGANYSYSFVATVNGTITIATTAGGFTSTPNPSLPGSNVTFTATVTNAVPGGPAPAGNVQFKTNGVALGDPVALGGGGVAAFITNSLPHGSNTVSAEYAGNGNFLGLTNSLVQIVNTPPTTANTNAATAQNQALVLGDASLLSLASDPDGDSLSITSAGPTSTNGGTVTLAGGNVTYQPVTDFVGTDLFSFVVSDPYGASATGTVLVAVTSASVPPPSVVVPPAYDSGSGTFSVTFAGIPNYTYSIQWAPSPTGPWTFLKTAAAGTDGLFEVTDTPSPQVSERYYRTVYP